MTRTLINACGADGGGAREILRRAIAHAAGRSIVVACPDISEFSGRFPSIEFVEVRTHGWRSAAFTLFGAARLARRHGCDTIISLMNFNVLSRRFKRITYFHQLNALDTHSPKSLLQALLVRLTHRSGDHMICQSPYVASRIKAVFGIVDAEHHWPGCSLPGSAPAMKGRGRADGPLLLVPLSNHEAYKNLDSVLAAADFFRDIGATVKITGSAAARSDGPFEFLPMLPRTELEALYHAADAVIFPSLRETLGLPVAEFLTTGKTAFVLRRPYTEGLYAKFAPLKNLVLYEEDFRPALRLWMESGCPRFEPRPDISIGDWGWISGYSEMPR